MKKIEKLIMEDLKRSGLSLEDAERMHLRSVGPEEMARIFPKAHVPACEFPYFDINGKLTGYCRYKLFGEFIPAGSKKSVKYLQPIGTKPQFYFPPFCDWKKISNNPMISIFFVEGEKKSSALAKLGKAAIGLGGIWSWRTRKDEISDPISDFNLINWQNRKTVIAFDSDV